jgi:hypothetical protein
MTVKIGTKIIPIESAEVCAAHLIDINQYKDTELMDRCCFRRNRLQEIRDYT